MERQRASSLPYMGLVDRRPVVCRNLAMGFWVPLNCQRMSAVATTRGPWRPSARRNYHMKPMGFFFYSSLQHQLVRGLMYAIGVPGKC